MAVQSLAIRRALGTEFREPALALGHFVDFLDREGAELITTNLALRWAMDKQRRKNEKSKAA
jgi:hypothetical protein